MLQLVTTALDSSSGDNITVAVPRVHHLLRSFASEACSAIDIFCNTLSIPRPGSEMDLIPNVVDLYDECMKHGCSIPE